MGTTYIKGSAPGFRDVMLPKAGQLGTPFGGSTSVTVTGSGRLVGVVLRGTGKATDGVNIWAGRVLGDRTTPSSAIVLGDYRLGSGGTYHFVKTSANTTMLPAGPYRLYLITDGAPVTVKLTLRGLGGVTTLRGLARAHAVLTTAPDRPAPRPVEQANLVMAGDSHVLVRRGLVMQAVRLETAAYVGGQYVFCHRNEPEDTPADSYAPTCLQRDAVVANDRFVEAGPSSELFVNCWAGVPAGYQSLGFTYLTQSVVTSMHTVALWLDY